MFTKPSVLLLGAGASKPYGFPTGPELIRQLLDDELTDAEKTALQNAFGTNKADYQHFIDHLRTVKPPSIDFYIEHHTQWREMAKFALAMKLMKCENRHSVMASIPPYNDHWYEYLFGELGNGLTKLGQNKLTVVTFNYELSFEFFLYTRIKQCYDADPSDCATIMSSIPVIHVYGQLGCLPWQSGTCQREFGSALDGPMIKAISQNILTISEARTTKVPGIVSVLNAAEEIYILGFGFIQDNVELIQLSNALGRSKVSASSFGFTELEVNEFRRRFSGCYFSSPVHKSCDFLRNCPDFLKNVWRTFL